MKRSKDVGLVEGYFVTKCVIFSFAPKTSPTQCQPVKMVVPTKNCKT